MSKQENPKDEFKIHCSQCGESIEIGQIVAHWQDKHGYKIYTGKESSD